MAMFPYKLGFWNVRSLGGKFAEVECVASWVDILGIAETRLPRGIGVALQGFCCYKGVQEGWEY